MEEQNLHASLSLNKTQTWERPSSKDENILYRVIRHGSKAESEGLDLWSCDCLGYRFGSRKASSFRCRHIKEVVAHLLEQYELTLLLGDQ